MKVDHKYKDKDVVVLDVALRSVGLPIEFKHVDLIMEVIKLVNAKGDQATIMDTTKIQVDWKQKWDMYEIESRQRPQTAGKDFEQ